MKSDLPKYGNTLILLLLFTSLQNKVSSWDLNGSWEAALQAKLLKDRPIVRPAHFNETLAVKLVLYPSTLQEINTAQQLVSIVATLGLIWQDDSLRWDPTKYENATAIYLPAARLWKPHFGLINSASDNVMDESKTHKYAVSAEYTGRMAWFIAETFTTMCDMDVVLFPFDTQTCSLNFTAWGLHAVFENYTGFGINKGYYRTNNEWDLVETCMGTQSSRLSLASHQSFVDFSFTFQRKPGFYIVTMVIPLTILSLLGLLVFALPAESVERLSLGITCLLSFSVIQASVTERLPSSFSTMPHIIKMLLFLMCFNGLSVAMAILTARIAGPPYRKMPEWLEKLLIISQKVDASKDDDSHTTSDGTVQIIDNEKIYRSKDSSSLKNTEPEEVVRITKNCSTQSENMEEKWKSLANLVNRIFFVMFSIALVAMILVIAVSWTLA